MISGIYICAMHVSNLEQVLWSAWRRLNPTWSRREIMSGWLGKRPLRPAQTRCAFLLLDEGAAAAFNTSGSVASYAPPRALALRMRGAGFTTNPLSQPAPRTHQTRVTNPHSWSSPCGLARVAQAAPYLAASLPCIARYDTCACTRRTLPASL